MELKPHSLYEDMAIARFYDDDEFMVAAHALLSSKQITDRLKGLRMRSLPMRDRITGNPEAKLARAHARPTNFKHSQLHHIEQQLAKNPPDKGDDPELDAAIIMNAIQEYFGTALPENSAAEE